MSRIVTRTTEEENRDLITKAAEEMAKKNEESLRKILEESKIGTSPRRSKVSQILNSSGTSEASQQTDDKEKEKNDIEKEKEKLEEIKKKERMELDKEKEKLKKELEESEVYCPTCSGAKHEHRHVLKRTEKGTLKCEDGECKTEYAMVPIDADYECSTCGLPTKRPKSKDSEESSTCPLCGNKEFIKHDWKWTKSANKKPKKLGIF